MSNLGVNTIDPNQGKIKGYLKMMGPAWLAIALNIGGATVTNASVLASKTGFQFMWAIIPEVFVIWIICVMMVRGTLATGEGPVTMARNKLGPWAGIVTGVSIFIVNTVFHAVQYALLGAVINTIFGVDAKIGAIVGFIFVLLIVFNPAKGEKNIKIIEKVLRIMCWILLASFVIILFVVDINWGGVFKGFIPTISSGSEDMIMLAGLMGAAIAINVPALAAYGTAQRKWGKDKKGLSFFELTYTNIMLIVVQFVVIIAVGSVLFPEGIIVNSGGAAAKAFEPFAGKFSVYIFGIGLLGAVLTTMVSQVLISGYIVSDMFKWEIDTNSKKFKWSELIVTFFGLTAPLFGWNAFKFVVYGSAFNLTFFPVIAILWIVMTNRKDIMGELVNTKKMNVGVTIAVILSIVATSNFWINLLK